MRLAVLGLHAISMLACAGWIPRLALPGIYWHTSAVLFYSYDSDAGSQIMTQGTVQLVAGILALVLVAIIILRRKGNKKKNDDEDF